MRKKGMEDTNRGGKYGKRPVRRAATVLAVLMALQLTGCQGNNGTGNAGADHVGGTGSEDSVSGLDGNSLAMGEEDGSGDVGSNVGGDAGGNAGNGGTFDGSLAGMTGKTADYEAEDLDAGWSEDGSVVITCDGTEVVMGDGGVEETGGAAAESGIIRITAAGTYILRGTYNGQIQVDAGKDDLVRLVMDGFNISNESTSPIYGKQSGKIVLILADGTENTVTDGTGYVFESADEDEPDAAIFSKDDLTINGQGTLTVEGNYSNAIRSKDNLKVISGILDIMAVKDGLKGKDSVSIKDGIMQIKTGQDGIKSSNEKDSEQGYVVIEGGTITIQAGDDGIHAETWLTISGGNIDIRESYEGLEGLKVDINGGTIKIKSTDDGINAAGGDGGIGQEQAEAGQEQRDAGEERVELGENGPESGQARAESGQARAESGQNQAEPGQEQTGRQRADMGKALDKMGDEHQKMQNNPEAYVRITGGTIEVDAMADGIDSNGNLYVEGGTIHINGPVSDGDGALDYNGTAVINNGIFVAAGSSGMMQGFSEESGQDVLIAYYSERQEAGTSVILTDESGRELLNFTPEKEFSCILISMPDLEQGKTYRLSTADASEEVVLDGVVTQLGERTGGHDRGRGPGSGTGNGSGAMSGGRTGRPGKGRSQDSDNES